MKENSNLQESLMGSQSEEKSTTVAVVTDEKKPESVVVDIVSSTPIVVFFGPPQIGKTVTLIRLARFLKQEKYQIEPDTEFRKGDSRYEDICKNFDANYLKTDFKPASTAVINFLLIKVKDQQKDICQLLEAPGEHYFDPLHPGNDYFPYFYKIINNGIPKIYLFFLELNWKNSDDREKYDNRVVNFARNLGKEDSVIILVNKADQKAELIHAKKPNEGAFKKIVREQYPNIYSTFLENSLFSATKYKSAFVAFSAGNFNSESHLFTNSIDFFPQNLWGKIRKRLRGGWL